MTQPAAPTVPSNGFGITALVLALSGLGFGLVPFTGFIALVLGLLAVLFGLLGRSYARRGAATNRTMTATSTALGIGAAALGVWGIVMMSGGVDKFGKNLQGVGHDTAAMGDVAVSDCSVTSEYGVSSVHATVKITNKADRAQSYLATIGVNDASGARIGEINTAGKTLGAGQSVSMSGTAPVATAAGGARPRPATCVVATVNRFPPVMTCPAGEVDAKFC
ncbi:MAG: hypothetical protein ABIZ05_17610 [Pseudonocardiaceae bacterium]